MAVKSVFASVLALSIAGALPLAFVPSAADAQMLRVASGRVGETLSVPMNRAVVVESDTPFSELSIANPGIADISTLSDRSIYVLGKAPGRTTLTILDAGGQLIANVEVHVAPDIAEFRERLRQILPNEQIEVRTANDGIVLSGTVSSITRLDAALQLAQRYAPERVSNLMTVGGTQQVMLRVRFSEVQRNVMQELGSTFSLTQPSGGPVSVPASLTASNGGRLGGTFGVGGLQFQVLMEALETNGMARTLSEPNLTALSGQQAYFLAGGEFPIPVVGEDGGVTIDYKPFGVELSFTPHVLDGGVINLTLNAAVSSIDGEASSTNNGVPLQAFRRRETSTTVELRDGESFAIAGMLQDDFRASSRQVPWLGDIPILGALFRSADYRRNQSELVIMITAHLVSPTRGEALMIPTDRIRLPSEADLFLNGRLSRGTSAVSEVARQDFRGPYGYTLD